MTTVGSWAWAKATYGKLTWRDKLLMMGEAVRWQVGGMLKRSPLQVDFPRAALDEIRLPDSSIAQNALQLAESVEPRALYLHSLRTYFWASILGKREKQAFDPELLFVMAMLHDVGLSDAHQTPQYQCFAVEGASVAYEFAVQHGWSAEQSEAIAAGIALHLNLIVTPHEGAEAYLMHDATMLDVIGRRLKDVPSEVRNAVLERYPRAEFKGVLIELFNRQYHTRPHSRITLMQQVGRLNGLIKRAPFES